MFISIRLCSSSSPTPRFLYKKLIRDCRKLPASAQSYYINFVRQGFGQHAEETDPERIEQITKRAIEDSKWILNKYKANK